MKACKVFEMPTNDVPRRSKVVVYVGKDIHEFEVFEEQARELLRVVMEYLGKPGK